MEYSPRLQTFIGGNLQSLVQIAPDLDAKRAQIDKYFKNVLKQKLFFITVTIRPEFYDSDAQEQVRYSLSQMRDYLVNTEYVMTFELTEQGNVHYHAIVNAESVYNRCPIGQQESVVSYIRKYLYNRRRKYNWLGKTDIQMVKYPEKVSEYLFKDYFITRKIVKINPYKTNISSLATMNDEAPCLKIRSNVFSKENLELI